MRTILQKLKDTITLPVRALTLFEKDRWGLSSLMTERFDYTSRYVRGYCLDVGCGKHNRFIVNYLKGNGKGIDVFPYAGLTEEEIVTDILCFPFPDRSFDTVTFIANLNHIPKSFRDAELMEVYRCLKPDGNIILTMGNPLAEILVHKIIALHDKLFNTNYDVDSERGMKDGEEYYVCDSEIIERLQRAGFSDIVKKYFATQWGLNHLFVAQKSGGKDSEFEDNKIEEDSV